MLDPALQHAIANHQTTEVHRPSVLLNWLGAQGLHSANQRKAVELYQRIESLPIADIHTHYDVNQIKSDVRWKTPTDVFLGKPAKVLAEGEANFGFDHYIAQLMLVKGVSPNLVYGFGQSAEQNQSKFEYRRFEAMIGAMKSGVGSEVYYWFKIALDEVFHCKLDPIRNSAKQIWDAVLKVIHEEPDFGPQKLLNQSNVKFALTTDDPTSDLSNHSLLGGPSLIPTWRADAVLMIDPGGRYDFPAWIKKLEAAAEVNITDLDKLKLALVKRIEYFKDEGCVAADLGIPNFLADDAAPARADDAFRDLLRGQIPGVEEKAQYQSHMLEWLLTKNAEYGFRQYIHQGPTRDMRSDLFESYGADIGGDGKGNLIDRKAMVKLFNTLATKANERSNDGTSLAPTIIFPINSEDFQYVMTNKTPFCVGSDFADAGDRTQKVQLGPPWWWNDSIKGIQDVIRMQISTGEISEWVGMLSDARSLTSVIARTKLFRAILAHELCTAPTLSHLDDAELFSLAEPICYSNGVRWLGLK